MSELSATTQILKAEKFLKSLHISFGDKKIKQNKKRKQNVKLNDF